MLLHMNHVLVRESGSAGQSVGVNIAAETGVLSDKLSA